MKLHIPHISIISVLLIFSACETESTPNAVNPSEMKVFAQYKGYSWNAGTEISIFDGLSNLKYSAAETSEHAEFISELKIDEMAEDLYALHPYDEDAIRTEAGIKLTIPSTQVISAPGMDERASKAIAYEDDFADSITLDFQDVCSYFKFSVTSDDKIVMVQIEGGKNEFIAGSAVVSCSGSEPVINIVGGAECITMISSSPMDGEYVICVLPAVLQDGLSVTLTAEDGSVIKKTIIAKNDDGLVSALVFVRGRVNRTPIMFDSVFAPVIEVPVSCWINGNTDSYRFNELSDIWK